MKWLQSVVALVLLVIWLPATSLCWLERAGWLLDGDCCPSSGSEQTPANGETTCCALASATYRADDQRPVAPVMPAGVLLALFVLIAPALPLAGPPSASGSPAPADLRNTWQFSCRAALSPRAPSFVS